MNKSITFCLILSFPLASCNIFNDAKPKYTQVYYNFITNEEVDFFKDNSKYDSEKMSAFDEIAGSRNIVLSGTRDSIHFFRTSSWHHSPLYIDYGNGDIDTLVTKYEPHSVHPLSEFNRLHRLQFFFNGELIADWNFEQEPNLRDSIFNRNRGTVVSYLPFPVPLIIPKEKDSDELKGG